MTTKNIEPFFRIFQLNVMSNVRTGISMMKYEFLTRLALDGDTNVIALQEIHISVEDPFGRSA